MGIGDISWDMFLPFKWSCLAYRTLIKVIRNYLNITVGIMLIMLIGVYSPPSCLDICKHYGYQVQVGNFTGLVDIIKYFSHIYNTMVIIKIVIWLNHYSDVIICAMASQITGVSIACPTVCSGAHQRKYQGSASLASVMGIHRRPVDSMKKRGNAENVSIWPSNRDDSCQYDKLQHHHWQ